MDWYTEKSKDPEYIARWSEDKLEPGINYRTVEENDLTQELFDLITEQNEHKERLAYLDLRRRKSFLLS